MTSCFAWLALLAFAIICMVSLIRWFEQITEAVDRGWWNKVIMLLLVPPTVWLYPSKVSAGRPTAVPHHEPVRGFGTAPLKPKDAQAPTSAPAPMPKRKRSPVDPEMVAKLKQKMKDQGMLGDSD
jgi:hypothetical protein